LVTVTTIDLMRLTHRVRSTLTATVMLCGWACSRAQSNRPIVSDPAFSDSRLRGTWGGQHIVLTVTESAAHVEFDCARGAAGRLVKCL